MAAHRVGLGILVSRLLGLVRQRLIADHFGASGLVDAWTAAIRIPNGIQNLLGEGSLSASFVPVYARLLQEGREKEAGRVAGGVLGLLVAGSGGLALLGAAAAPWVTYALTGYSGTPTGETITTLLRIFFPMMALMVCSAWVLGILNSHRRFFASYVAPALWNLSMIVVMLALGTRVLGEPLLEAVAWGALAGGLLQLAFQAVRAAPFLKSVVVSFGARVTHVREVFRKLLPAVLARGAVHVSGLVDLRIASHLAAGSYAVIGYAQTLYVLPISLFAMSVAAAELPELSRAEARRRSSGRDQGYEQIRTRAHASVRRVLFWMVPSTAAFLTFGPELVGAVYQVGEFGRAEAEITAMTLAAYSLGLCAAGSSRVLVSAFFAMGDTKYPARVAYRRVLVSGVCAAGLALTLNGVPGPRGFSLGPVGLALGSAAGAWTECWLLHRALVRRIGRAASLLHPVAGYLAAAAAGVAASLLLRGWTDSLHAIIAALLLSLAFGIPYLLLTRLFGVSAFRLPLRLGGHGRD